MADTAHWYYVRMRGVAMQALEERDALHARVAMLDGRRTQHRRVE